MKMQQSHVFAVVALTSVIACSAKEREEQTGSGSGSISVSDGTNPELTSGSTTDTADASETTGSTSRPTTVTTDTDTSGAAHFDVGSPGAETSNGPGDTSGQGCKSIDFLFAIDNSLSMASAQTNMQNSFGPFMDTITNEVEADSFHVMVVDSDACWTSGNSSCPVTGCENTLGSGFTGTCAMPDTRRYLTSELAPDQLKSTFQCIANVGTNGSWNELPMSAMVDAISTQAAAGACNDGFLRDDAVLVVTIISDDHAGWSGPDYGPATDDSTTVGTPQAWYDALVAAKHGRAESIVVLGLLLTLDNQACNSLSFDGPDEATKFLQFVQLFGPHGVIGNVCETNYAPFFQNAVGLIGSTCDEFEPPE